MQMVIVGPVIQATIKMAQSVVAFLQTLIQITIAIIGIAALVIEKVEVVVKALKQMKWKMTKSKN